MRCKLLPEFQSGESGERGIRIDLERLLAPLLTLVVLALRPRFALAVGAMLVPVVLAVTRPMILARPFVRARRFRFPGFRTRTIDARCVGALSLRALSFGLRLAERLAFEALVLLALFAPVALLPDDHLATVVLRFARVAKPNGAQDQRQILLAAAKDRHHVGRSRKALGHLLVRALRANEIAEPLQHIDPHRARSAHAEAGRLIEAGRNRHFSRNRRQSGGR